MIGLPIRKVLAPLWEWHNNQCAFSFSPARPDCLACSPDLILAGDVADANSREASDTTAGRADARAGDRIVLCAVVGNDADAGFFESLKSAITSAVPSNDSANNAVLGCLPFVNRQGWVCCRARHRSR